MAEIKALEHPTLKVPYEILNKKFRIAQKAIDREYNQFHNVTTEIEKSLTDGSTAGDISKLVGGFVERIKVLKRKADENISEELAAIYVCKRRLEHLKQNIYPPLTPEAEVKVEAVNQWKKIRLDRMIVEHFLRQGYYESAEKLAIRSGIKDLTNLDIFQTCREVEEDLAKHSTVKCSMWCNDNKSKLRKINSTIEFQLRRQDFVELVRQDKRVEAVKHARKYFSVHEGDQLFQIRQCMTLLAFPADTEIEPYRSYFDLYRWDDLILNFRLENYRLFQLATQSVLNVVVQAGLSALKTPQCYSTASKNKNCPVCQELFNEIADKLPYSHCAQSRLICRVTGKPLNEYNLPMMLPNGQVYGEQALPHITKEKGVVVCPKTKQTFIKPKIEKVFVM